MNYLSSEPIFQHKINLNQLALIYPIPQSPPTTKTNTHHIDFYFFIELSRIIIFIMTLIFQTIMPYTSIAAIYYVGLCIANFQHSFPLAIIFVHLKKVRTYHTHIIIYLQFLCFDVFTFNEMSGILRSLRVHCYAFVSNVLKESTITPTNVIISDNDYANLHWERDFLCWK